LFPYKPTTPKGVVFFWPYWLLIHNVDWHLSYTHRCLDTGEYGLANSNLKIRFHVREFIVWQTLSYKTTWVPDRKIVVWQNRIWYSISTDIIGYANQVSVTIRNQVVLSYMPNNMRNGETGEGGWYYINIVLTSNS